MSDQEVVEHRQLAIPGGRRPCYAVTGGLGFVGSRLVRQLIAVGDVRIVDVLPESAAVSVTELGCSYHRADLRRPEEAAAAFEGVDMVYHLAGNASGTRSVTDPQFDFDTNASATLNVCAAALTASVQRLVFLSTAMVYGRPRYTPIGEDHATDPFLPYGASKLSAEHIVQSYHHSYGLDTVIGRAFTIYGPGEDPKTAGGEVGQYLRWHLNGRPVLVVGSPNDKTRDFIHVDDLATALITLGSAGKSGEVYNLGTGGEYSMSDLVSMIAEVSGREVEVAVDGTVTDDSYRHVPDVTKLQALGVPAPRQLREGIRQLIEELGPNPELPGLPTAFRAEKFNGQLAPVLASAEQ